jgi:hypothetical protein
MTREQGYRLFHLIFESEDQRAGYVYYGPSQKMIHVLPLNGQCDRFQENDFVNLGEIAEYGFLDIGSLEHWITKETVSRSEDFSDSLTNEYLELIDYIETPAGQYVVYHTLAHNNFIKRVLGKRIELWKSFLKIYYDQSAPLEDVIQKLTVEWPRASQRIATSVVEEYSEYELMYRKEYREIKKTFSDDNLSWCYKMAQLAFIIEEAFAVERNYEEIRNSAIKAIASQNSFDNQTPWQTSNLVFEEFLSIQENFEQRLKSQFESHQQQLQKLASTLESHNAERRAEHVEIKELIAKPEADIFKLGVESGALARGDDSDPRYIIQGPMQKMLNQWMEYLTLKGYTLDMLPTASTIDGLLRRIKPMDDPEKERASIAHAMHRVKEFFKL